MPGDRRQLFQDPVLHPRRRGRGGLTFLATAMIIGVTSTEERGQPVRGPVRGPAVDGQHRQRGSGQIGSRLLGPCGGDQEAEGITQRIARPGRLPVEHADPVVVAKAA